MTNREKRGTNRTYGWEAGAVWERQFFKKLLAKPKSILKSRKLEFDGYLDDEKRDALCFDGVPVYVKELVAGGFTSALSKTSVVPLERVKILWQMHQLELDQAWVLGW
ncbi:hypothetical protein RJT34_12923 [Clitoria ternatea]|uniref:Uncharacterized protein n=1 Tax=Clitoria ternatea TaxID=43366 RepID=A0AAN9PLD1_CLITE